MGSQTDASIAAQAVGLSDPQYTARRKKMFEFLTRVRAIGCVPLPRTPATIHLSML